ncbi:MAG: HAD family phosphatase [Actinobacteria bacterium]|nr:HAD family phosphatase [Actinomycetota bacterium]
MVFDLDGVLIDSEPVWREVEAEVAGEFGFTYSDELAGRMHGRGVRGVADIVAEQLGDPDRALAAAESMVERMVERGSRGLVPIMPGAPELISALRGRAKLAVASNSVRRYVEGSVSQLGPFDVVVAGDEVDHAKPAPDIYLRAAERLGEVPARCVAVEDSPVGIAAAQAAGMPVVAIEGLAGPLEIEAFPSLSAVTAEDLLAPAG